MKTRKFIVLAFFVSLTLLLAPIVPREA